MAMHSFRDSVGVKSILISFRETTFVLPAEWPLSPCSIRTLSSEDAGSLAPAKPVANAYLTEHDAITRTMHSYVAGARAGDGDLMRSAFHPFATISGYCQGVEYSGSVEHVFQWVTENGPAPNINPRFARIEIIESIAVVHLEVQRWSGKLAGANARASDVFTLLKWNGEWKITHKLFHWHGQ